MGKLLLSLPEGFKAKKSSLEDSRNINKLPLLKLIKSLQAQHQGKAIRNKDDEHVKKQKAIRNKNDDYLPKNKNIWSFQKIGHEEIDCWHKDKPQCFICKKFEHVQKYCRNKIEKSIHLIHVSEKETLF